MEKIKTLESSNFESTSELEVVKLLLKNAKFTAKYYRYLSPSLFREQYRPIVEISLGYWKQHGKLVPMEAMLQELRFKVGTNITQEKMNSMLQVLIRLQQESKAPEYIEAQISSFVKFQRVENALIASFKKLTEAEKNKDSDQLRDIVSLITRANADLDVRGSTYWLSSIDKRTDYRERMARGEIDSTGFGSGIPDLDDLIPITYGIKTGEIAFWIGTTGRGKSVALIHCALTAALRGFSVLYVSLELSEENLLSRADANATKTQIGQVVEKRDDIRTFLAALMADTGRPLADIAFKEFPSAGTTVLDIKNELLRMQQSENFTPRLIIVDYIDLLMPTRHVKEGGWKEQQVVTQELRDLGGEVGAAVWTASQGNRGAAHRNNEGELMSDADVAESYSKMGVADLIVTINRTKEQVDMPEPKPAYLFVAKNRNGIAGKKIGILTDFRIMSFYEGPYEKIPNLVEMEKAAMSSGAIRKRK